MRKKRMTESDERRRLRLAEKAERRTIDAKSEDRAIDTMVLRSIEVYGP